MQKLSRKVIAVLALGGAWLVPAGVCAEDLSVSEQGRVCSAAVAECEDGCFRERCLASVPQKHTEPTSGNFLALHTLLRRQERVVGQAGQCIDDAIYGRTNMDDAYLRVRKVRAQGEAVGKELHQYQQQHPSYLAQVASKLGGRYSALLQKMEALLARGVVDRGDLREFQLESAELTKEMVEQWLNAQLRWARYQRDASKSAQLREYCAWQCQLIPIRKKMCALSQNVLGLLADIANNRRVDEVAAQKWRREVASQINAMKAVKVGSSFAEAQRGCIAELQAFDKLIEAAILLNGDRSEDSTTRVERCNRILRQKSEQAADGNVAVLQAVVGG